MLDFVFLVFLGLGISTVLTVIITALIVIGVAKDWYDSKYMILLLIVMVVVLVYFGLHIILGR